MFQLLYLTWTKCSVCIYYSCFCLFLLIFLTEGVKITTPQGKINGDIKKTLNGREFEAYLGIPYAKPPVDELRFKVSIFL